MLRFPLILVLSPEAILGEERQVWKELDNLGMQRKVTTMTTTSKERERAAGRRPRKRKTLRTRRTRKVARRVARRVKTQVALQSRHLPIQHIRPIRPIQPIQPIQLCPFLSRPRLLVPRRLGNQQSIQRVLQPQPQSPLLRLDQRSRLSQQLNQRCFLQTLQQLHQR